MLELFFGILQTAPGWMTRLKVWIKVTARSKVKKMHFDIDSHVFFVVVFYHLCNKIKVNLDFLIELTTIRYSDLKITRYGIIPNYYGIENRYPSEKVLYLY